MPLNETLQIQGSDSEDHKGWVFIRKNQLFWIAILVIALVVGVGLLSYYIPNRVCPPPVDPPPTTTDQVKTTTDWTTVDVTTTKEMTMKTEEPTPKRLSTDVSTTTEKVTSQEITTITDTSTTSHVTTEGIPTTDEMTTGDSLTTKQSATEAPYPCRLPTDVVPISYEIFLKPYLNEEDVEGTSRDRFTFDGNAVIVMKCLNETNRITLNSNDINISSVGLIGPDLSTFLTWVYEPEFQLVHINLEDDEYLRVGETYTLNIVYVGQLNDLFVGFYRGSYTNSTGHRSWVSSSQGKNVILWEMGEGWIYS